MDNHEISIDTESTGIITTPSTLLPSSQTNEQNIEIHRWSELLEDALRKNDWDSVKRILDRVPDAMDGPVGQYNVTPLVFAVREDLDMIIIEKLIDLTTPPEKLAYSVEESVKTQTSVSAIHWAAINGNYLAAKLLIPKHPAMLKCFNWYKQTPIQEALSVNKTEMACYMLKLCVTHVKDRRDFELTFKMDLEYALKNGKYDFAYILVQYCRKLASDESIWKWLIEECDDFPCRSRLNIFQSYIYPRIHMDHNMVSDSLHHEWDKANSRFRSAPSGIRSQHQYSHGNENSTVETPVAEEHRGSSDEENHDLASSDSEYIASSDKVSLFKSVHTLKLKHHQALEFVRRLCLQTKNLSIQDCHNFIRLVFWLAIHNGVSDIVEIILRSYHDAIEYKDVDGNNALQYTVSHRDGKTFHVIHEQIKNRTCDITSSIDNRGNNLLHLVAKKARRNRLGTGSRKVLQLQREFQWYKEMEKVLPSHLKFKKNKKHQVPLEVFDEEHTDMLKSESEWLTSMSNSCMVAGSLIASVVFAASITFPGGNNDDDGLPKFSKEWALKVFALSVAFALVSSLTSVMTFLSIFITRYSVESFQYDLPRRLITGLISLFLAVTFLMMSFMTTVYLLYEKYLWIIYPTFVVSSVPVWFPLYLQIPSLVNIIKSTYGRNIYYDDNVTVLDKR